VSHAQERLWPGINLRASGRRNCTRRRLHELDRPGDVGVGSSSRSLAPAVVKLAFGSRGPDRHCCKADRVPKATAEMLDVQRCIAFERRVARVVGLAQRQTVFRPGNGSAPPTADGPKLQRHFFAADCRPSPDVTHEIVQDSRSGARVQEPAAIHAPPRRFSSSVGNGFCSPRNRGRHGKYLPSPRLSDLHRVTRRGGGAANVV